MIFDRTQQDVDLAKALRLKLQMGYIVQDGELMLVDERYTLTDEEFEQLERGTCTISMLNRIFGKINELSQKLNELMYRGSSGCKSDWAYGDIFSKVDIKEMFGKLERLKQSFFVYENTPKMPSNLYQFQNANDTEKILQDLEDMKNGMISRFRECGTFECGETNNL